MVYKSTVYELKQKQMLWLRKFFNERKLVLGATHVKVKVKVKVQIKKLRNIGILPWSLDDLEYC